METKKEIEQEIRYNIEIGLDSSGDAIILTQGTDLYRSGIGIEKSNATEVAKAIDPKYQELEERCTKYFTSLIALVNQAQNEHCSEFMEVPLNNAIELIKEEIQRVKAIQQSKSKDNE